MGDTTRTANVRYVHKIEVFQFTLNMSLLNCFLSNTFCCCCWCYCHWGCCRTPQGKTAKGISVQDGEWYNVVVDALARGPSSPHMQCGCFRWKFSFRFDALFSGFMMVNYSTVWYAARYVMWICSAKLWLPSLYSREFFSGVNFLQQGVSWCKLCKFV